MTSLRHVLRVVTAVGLGGMGALHFVPGPGRGMSAMIPPGVRRVSPVSTTALVRFTGVCELAGGAGLLLAPTRRLAAGALVVFLAAVFPANAFAASRPERFGRAAVPVVPRAVAQVGLVALVVAIAR